MRKRRRPTEPMEAIQDRKQRATKGCETEGREAETTTKSSEDARVEKGTASGQAWEMSCRLLGARPWFTPWKPRVFRLAALRPGTALCTG